jgi:hypothetical protein
MTMPKSLPARPSQESLRKRQAQADASAPGTWARLAAQISWVTRLVPETHRVGSLTG